MVKYAPKRTTTIPTMVINSNSFAPLPATVQQRPVASHLVRIDRLDISDNDLCSSESPVRSKVKEAFELCRKWAEHRFRAGELGSVEPLVPGARGLVGMPGFEPGASTSRTWRAAKLRYIPFRGGSVPQAGRSAGGCGLERLGVLVDHRSDGQASVGAVSGSGTTNR
jgi:hypothetical protein